MKHLSKYVLCIIYVHICFIYSKLYGGGAQIKVLIMVPYRSEMRKPLVQRTYFMAVQL